MGDNLVRPRDEKGIELVSDGVVCANPNSSKWEILKHEQTAFPDLDPARQRTALRVYPQQNCGDSATLPKQQEQE